MKDKLIDLFFISFILLVIVSSICNIYQSLLIYDKSHIVDNNQLKTFYYTDMDTCVLYLQNDKGLSVMLDKNSKVMLDQECVLSKEKNK